MRMLTPRYPGLSKGYQRAIRELSTGLSQGHHRGYHRAIRAIRVIRFIVPLAEVRRYDGPDGLEQGAYG